MSLKLAFSFASRYYNASFSNPYIKFINRASRWGISIGVAALIIGLSIMNGFERALQTSLLSVIPDVEYEAVNGKLPDWTKTAERVLASPDVVGAAPYIKMNAMVQKQNVLEAVIVHGVEPSLESTVNKTTQLIVKGQWLTNKISGAVIGAGLAEKLSLQVSDRIEMLIPSANADGKLSAPKYLNLEIVGIYKIGGQMDYGQVYLPLATVQSLQKWQATEAEGIKVALKQPFEARNLARRIGQTLSDYVYVLDWFRSHGHVYNDIVLVKDIMYLAMFLVMAVASFNIVSSLTMAVQEKHSDIAILKTIGLQGSVMKSVFVLMGLLTASRGVVWGAVIGVLITLNLSMIMATIENVLGVKTLDADVYFIDHIPTQIEPLQVLLVVLTALIISFLATLYPASQAAKLKPVELLASH